MRLNDSEKILLTEKVSQSVKPCFFTEQGFFLIRKVPVLLHIPHHKHFSLFIHKQNLPVSVPEHFPVLGSLEEGFPLAGILSDKEDEVIGSIIYREKGLFLLAGLFHECDDLTRREGYDIIVERIRSGGFLRNRVQGYSALARDDFGVVIQSILDSEDFFRKIQIRFHPVFQGIEESVFSSLQRDLPLIHIETFVGERPLWDLE